MIDKVWIRGYKCLLDTSIESTNLNILVGPNASGKSSLLQALLLLRQSSNKEGIVEYLHLSGPLYEAGTAIDVLNPNSNHTIEITLFENDSEVGFRFHHDRDTETQESKRLIKADSPEILPRALFERGKSFFYLNAERIGPRVSYSLPPDIDNMCGLIGKHGEYTTALLARHSASELCIDEWTDDFATLLCEARLSIDKYDMSDAVKSSLGRIDIVTNLILNWIIPGASFEATENDFTDSASLRFIRDPLKTKSSVRPTHIGFGLAYALPIIAAALTLDKNGTLIVENPEAHLHPFSQSRIGVVLALIASSGRQIWVETHSDHVVNGIRLAVSKGLVQPDKINFTFFDQPINGDTAKTSQIKFLPNGRLERWPRGFFDQIENDLSEL